MDPAVTYSSYLHVDELLDLQQPRSEGPEHDELLFIVIHQVYELWFKELLHELDRVDGICSKPAIRIARSTRSSAILTILKVLVAQLDILETMTPLEFLSFRERLEAASGFQSDQFRQLEFVLGAQVAPARSSALRPAAARAPALERRFGSRRCGTPSCATWRARGTRCQRLQLDARRDRSGRAVAGAPATS